MVIFAPSEKNKFGFCLVVDTLYIPNLHNFSGDYPLFQKEIKNVLFRSISQLYDKGCTVHGFMQYRLESTVTLD